MRASVTHPATWWPLSMESQHVRPWTLRQTSWNSYVVGQDSSQRLGLPYGPIHHTSLVEVVTRQPRFKGRENRFHLLIRKRLKGFVAIFSLPQWLTLGIIRNLKYVWLHWKAVISMEWPFSSPLFLLPSIDSKPSIKTHPICRCKPSCNWHAK